MARYYQSQRRNRGFGWGSVLLLSLLGLMIVWVSNHFGLWYITLIVGFLLAITIQRSWRAMLASWIAGIGGWGLPLVWQAYGQHLPISQTAQVVSLSMGFGKNALLVVGLTLILGFLLCTVGAWLGASLIGVIRPERAASRRIFS